MKNWIIEETGSFYCQREALEEQDFYKQYDGILKINEDGLILLELETNYSISKIFATTQQIQGTLKNGKKTFIQLADMVVGAIARSYATNRKDEQRWKKILDKKIDNIWNFV